MKKFNKKFGQPTPAVKKRSRVTAKNLKTLGFREKIEQQLREGEVTIRQYF